MLGALDDKIDLNRRMNETLESMARAIFKSWFVEFDPVRAKVDGQRPQGMDPEAAALYPKTLRVSNIGGSVAKMVRARTLPDFIAGVITQPSIRRSR